MSIMTNKQVNNSLQNCHIVLGLTASIACYKSVELVRLLREQGAQVQVVMTESAQAFMTPLTLQAISGHAVKTGLLDPESEASMDHISLARWAEIILIAPASANCMAKLAYGMADDLLSTLCLATTAPIALAPAMNQQMWQNSATQHNQAILLERGIKIWGPNSGSQACGEYGPGRIQEPTELLAQVIACFKQPGKLSGLRIIITAGPTHENIDPVRYISNHSSGRMGYALAEAAQAMGAEVMLISGPSTLSPPKGVKFCSVITAEEMLSAVMQNIKNCDIFIAAAAVTDFKPVNTNQEKIKKTSQQDKFELALQTNPDILNTVTALKNPPFTIGFAAETEDLEAHALKKLAQKKVDMIAANWIGPNNPGGGFGSENNALTVFWQGGKQEFSLRPKQQLARDLLELITKLKPTYPG